MARVEFFGVARLRAGVDSLEVPATTLGDIFDQLTLRLPGFSAQCLQNGQLRADFIASINGDRFVRDRSLKISANAAVLILSVDAGG